jgi:hypothetical protein
MRVTVTLSTNICYVFAVGLRPSIPRRSRAPTRRRTYLNLSPLFLCPSDRLNSSFMFFLYDSMAVCAKYLIFLDVTFRPPKRFASYKYIFYRVFDRMKVPSVEFKCDRTTFAAPVTPERVFAFPYPCLNSSFSSLSPFITLDIFLKGGLFRATF